MMMYLCKKYIQTYSLQFFKKWKTPTVFKRVQHITIFREEATSPLAGFRAGPLSWLNGNLEMLVSVKRGKPEAPPPKKKKKKKEKKTSSKQDENQKHTQPTSSPTRVIFLGSKRSHHCATTAPPSPSLTAPCKM